MKTQLVVKETQEEVKPGDEFNLFALSEKVRIQSWSAPYKPGNTGIIHLVASNGKTYTYPPATCGLEFIERRSVEPIPPVSV